MKEGWLIPVSEKNVRYYLAAALVTAAVLRLSFLGQHSFWVDELFSLKFAYLGTVELVANVAGYDNHPPLYYLLLHFWERLFGDSEFAVRSLSVVFSVLSVALVFSLGRLLYNMQLGILAAFILALSKFSIYYAQEARMYSLLPFLGLLSVYFFWKLIHSPRLSNFIGYVISTTLLLYTHSYGLFILIAQNVHVVMVAALNLNDLRRTAARVWLPAQMSVVILFLPWAFVLFKAVLNLHAQGFWVQKPTLESLAGTFSEFAGSGPLLRVLFAALVTVAAVHLLRELMKRLRSGNWRLRVLSNEAEGTTLLLLCLFVPVVVPFIVSQFGTSIYLTRSVGVGYFAFCLLIARGIMGIKWKSLAWSAMAVSAVLSVNLLLVDGYVHAGDAKYRELVAHIKQHAPKNALIVLCGDDHLSRPFMHYAVRTQLEGRTIRIDDKTILNNLFPNEYKSQIWLITFEERIESMRECGEVPRLISAKYKEKVVSDSIIHNFGVRVFERSP